MTTETIKQPTKTEQIAADSFAAGRKLSEREFRAAGGPFGDYYFNVYNRAWNKLKKQAEEAAKQEFAGANASLLNTLFEQTQILKEEYLEKTARWAEEDFARMEKYVLKNATKNGGTYYFNLIRNRETETEKEFYARQDRARVIGNIYVAGLEAFKAREEKLAILHYENSIHKLAARIEKKNLDKANLSIKTARVEQNIETVFTDGKQIVKAFTIIASGPVQKPHYRYLVK